MKKYIRIVYTACLLLFLVSCKDTHEKAQDFVDDYNLAAGKLASVGLQSTIAELKPNNTIYIVMVSTIPVKDERSVFIGQSLPTIMSDMLRKMPNFQELVEEGVKFSVEFRAADNAVLGETTVDKTSLKALAGKNAKADEMDFGTKDAKAKEMLITINKPLPFVDKEAGTTITKIDMIGEDLVYIVEVDDELKKLLKEDGFKVTMKQQLIQNPQMKVMLHYAREYDIRNIRCRYIGADKKIVTEIVIHEKELQ